MADENTVLLEWLKKVETTLQRIDEKVGDKADRSEVDALEQSMERRLESAVAKLGSSLEKVVASTLEPIKKEQERLEVALRDEAEERKDLTEKVSSSRETLVIMQSSQAKIIEDVNNLNKVVLVGNGEPSLAQLVKKSLELAEQARDNSAVNTEKLNQLVTKRKFIEGWQKAITAILENVMKNGPALLSAVGFPASIFGGLLKYVQGIGWEQIAITSGGWIFIISLLLLIMLRGNKANGTI